MDIEFSHTDCSLSPVTGPDEAMTPLMTGRHTHFDAVKRRVAMMGTAQFMAYEVLDAINGNIPLVYDCHHDIESFIWVLCYTVGRCWVSAPGIMDSDRHERLCEFFHDNFGCDTLYSIMQVRTGLSGPLDIARRFPEIVSPPLVLLFGHLRALVYAAHAPPHSLNPAVALTYDVVLDLFITTIKELMGS
ncbi:hypothetical protein BD410DRAFT_837717 [Rickenella mellea]|uniref:Fungal-type protein kinase domain-containing protein n=1 Tax=Rickenella mellea TaxID=50990 RepID=A0A4Y7QBH3_9AGAM|nr:hypothetical protein BD410DRAFT_837717 [Rickenella mellea]